MHFLPLSLCFLLMFALPLKTYAVEADDLSDETLISLFGAACETIKQDEAKSSVRVRATDKASFKSVENIAELSDYRNKLPTHDFNVLVYGIVDNYIEDLSIKTTKQNSTEICVETTGYLHSENILKAINENYQKFSAQTNTFQESPNLNEYPQSLDIEKDKPLIQAVTDFPPPPKLTDRGENSFDEEAAYEDNHISAASGTTAVFIEKTRFYNGTTTNAYYADLKSILLQKSGISIVSDKNNADYIVKSNVLRAKVDPINNKTNRLQMVVSLELFDTHKETDITEHQNRFILFESNEDEQIVASSLMKKLFARAGEIIVNKISTKSPGAIIRRDAIITPSGNQKATHPRPQHSNPRVPESEPR